MAAEMPAVVKKEFEMIRKILLLIRKQKRDKHWLAINQLPARLKAGIEQPPEIERIDGCNRGSTFLPMYHWTDKRIRGHICLCYLATTLLNRTLLKMKPSGLKTSENQLRKLLDSVKLKNTISSLLSNL